MKRIIKLPWVKIQESADKTAQKTKIVENDISLVKNLILENKNAISETSRSLSSTSGRVDIIEECASESELEMIALSRRIKSLESRVVQIEFFKDGFLNSVERESLFSKAMSACKSSLLFLNRFVEKHHLLMSSIVLMAAAAAGLTYLFVYLM